MPLPITRGNIGTPCLFYICCRTLHYTSDSLSALLASSLHRVVAMTFPVVLGIGLSQRPSLLSILYWVVAMTFPLHFSIPFVVLSIRYSTALVHWSTAPSGSGQSSSWFNCRVSSLTPNRMSSRHPKPCYLLHTYQAGMKLHSPFVFWTIHIMLRIRYEPTILHAGVPSPLWGTA